MKLLRWSHIFRQKSLIPPWNLRYSSCRLERENPTGPTGMDRQTQGGNTSSNREGANWEEGFKRRKRRRWKAGGRWGHQTGTVWLKQNNSGYFYTLNHTIVVWKLLHNRSRSCDDLGFFFSLDDFFTKYHINERCDGSTMADLGCFT